MSEKNIRDQGESAFFVSWRLSCVGGLGQWRNGGRRQKYVKGCKKGKQVIWGAQLEKAPSSCLLPSLSESLVVRRLFGTTVAGLPALPLTPQQGCYGAALFEVERT